MSVYDLQVEKSNGEMESLSEHKGQILLIVNTASKCGFTPQFEGLQKLYETYKDEGFKVLGFPSDQFMNQEFEQQEEILEFCQTNYGVTFPVYKKIDVKGDHKAPLFKYLTEEKKGLLGGEIKWNFTKFLVDRNGNVVERYSPQTKPEKIEEDIKALIKGS
ncbi:glutathione peroxidase [Piscibacillus halophilus]|uniref:Glutathione peroxidase n=1 Tax=Piscibacillus halophilus TaxID=571933 RepID=A0A1H9GYD7_9BACI|nr:glutathione peroxidase [Piscibacillus halophilus]SEQ55055.1 glutathione peroxidase [Piscibacillus halophilus]